MAIRQLRIWPLDPNAKAVDDFLHKALLISEEDSGKIVYDNIEAVASAPRARQHKEICVTFRDAGMKDIVLLYGMLGTYLHT